MACPLPSSGYSGLEGSAQARSGLFNTEGAVNLARKLRHHPLRSSFTAALPKPAAPRSEPSALPKPAAACSEPSALHKAAITGGSAQSEPSSQPEAADTAGCARSEPSTLSKPANSGRSTRSETSAQVQKCPEDGQALPEEAGRAGSAESEISQAPVRTRFSIVETTPLPHIVHHADSAQAADEA